MTVMTLNIHHHGTSGLPVPPLVRAVCFRWLRRLLCLNSSGGMRQSRHRLQNVIEVDVTCFEDYTSQLVYSCSRLRFTVMNPPYSGSGVGGL